MNNSSALRPWIRPLALLTAVFFFISSAFPLAAGLEENPGAFSKWWGILDVGIAFVLIILVTQGKIDKQAEGAAYRAYCVLIHAILGMIVVFFLFGNHISWTNCLTGFAWRSWLLMYGLPSWLTAIRANPNLSGSSQIGVKRPK